MNRIPTRHVGGHIGETRTTVEKRVERIVSIIEREGRRDLSVDDWMDLLCAVIKECQVRNQHAIEDKARVLFAKPRS